MLLSENWGRNFISTGWSHCYYYQNLDYYGVDCRCNIKIDLWEITPKILQGLIRKRVIWRYREEIASGYMRQLEETYDKIFPQPLREVIWKYYRHAHFLDQL